MGDTFQAIEPDKITIDSVRENIYLISFCEVKLNS